VRFDKMSSLAVKHSCDSAARSLKLVHTSIDSLTADLKTLADAGYHHIEPLRNRYLLFSFQLISVFVTFPLAIVLWHTPAVAASPV